MPRGGSNYIPRKDGEFAAWVQHYYDGVKAFWDGHGLDTNELIPLETALLAWNTAYPAHVAAQAAAEAARATKDQRRAALERQVRPITNYVQAYIGTTDADRAAIGITIRDGSKTPAPPPTSAPLAQVDSGQRLTHRLRFTDAAAPTRRGKPPGTIGAEVWVKVEAVGSGPSASGNAPGAGAPSLPLPTAHSPLPLPGFTFLAVSSRGNLQTDFPSTEAGKVAHYALRWVSTRGDKGPWSDIVTGTVAA